ncbi:AbrB/MazE/SpoVT family DNA-binding domain-containing protein [Candidatus Dependentiae bacterium]|nr:AbrB/MazE/SpoVT family DNA-binding domain-containing protein [Candidatus Dependentiae bacterium]
MIKKLSKHGNSLAILIDKPILELLEVNEDTQFKIKVEEGSLILEPIRQQPPVSTISKDPKLQAIYEDLFKKYEDLFKKLADS